MTWPVCVKCQYEFIPIPALQGCPWCSGKAERIDPTETWRDRRNRKNREARARARTEATT